MNECMQLLCLLQMAMKNFPATKKGNHNGLHFVIHHSMFSFCLVAIWGHGLEEKLMQEKGKEHSGATHSTAERQKEKETKRKCVFAGSTRVASLLLLPTDKNIHPLGGWNTFLTGP